MSRDMVSLRQWCRLHRPELERIIRIRCGNLGRLTLEDIGQWVVNDEDLYLWARRDCADV